MYIWMYLCTWILVLLMYLGLTSWIRAGHVCSSIFFSCDANNRINHHHFGLYRGLNYEMLYLEPETEDVGGNELVQQNARFLAFPPTSPSRGWCCSPGKEHRAGWEWTSTERLRVKTWKCWQIKVFIWLRLFSWVNVLRINWSTHCLNAEVLLFAIGVDMGWIALGDLMAWGWLAVKERNNKILFTYVFFEHGPQQININYLLFILYIISVAAAIACEPIIASSHPSLPSVSGTTKNGRIITLIIHE